MPRKRIAPDMTLTTKQREHLSGWGKDMLRKSGILTDLDSVHPPVLTF